jgi:alkylresorcinol/alkylpyrone synthase
MAVINSLGISLPKNIHSQAEVTQALAKKLTTSSAQQAVLDRVHKATGVMQRHFPMPIEDYLELRDFSHTNQLFAEHALPLVEEAISSALEQAGLEAKDVDMMFFTTVTGVGAPSLDALIASDMGFRSDLKRIPSFGLGCVAGAAGIARVADYLQGHPKDVALLVSVELCSLTVQWQDTSMANFIGTGLFGDGAAAAVMLGDEHPLAGSGITVVDTLSALYPDTSHMIGWKIGTSGFSLMLEAGVPAMIEKHFAKDVAALLEKNNLAQSDIDVWLAHPGGPKVLTAFTSSLGISDEKLASSWAVLANTGNMSSAAVLHVLASEMKQPSGTKGLLFALGPGVTAELVLLEWK